MIERLSSIQKFLKFLTQNIVALLLVLLSLSITANVYLVKWIKELYEENDSFKDKTIEYERMTKDKLMDISKEQNVREQIISGKKDITNERSDN